MTGRLIAFSLALTLPLASPGTGFAQENQLGPEAEKLAAALAAEGCLLSGESSPRIEKHLDGMSETDIMTAAAQLMLLGALVEETGDSYRLKGFGC